MLILYADIFGAHAFYQLIPLPLTFALMSAVTIAAFLLAVHLDAQVVMVLGLVGGFLTPPLLMESPDNPALLFGYVGLLNAGLAAVALRKRWDYLFVLGAIGTALTEFAWLPAKNENHAAAGMAIFLGMQALFLSFAFLRQRQTPVEKWSTAAAAITGFASIGFACWLLDQPELATRPGLFFVTLFLADSGLLLLAFWRPNPAALASAAGTVVFLALSAWTAWYLNAALLWWALGAYLLFAVMHAGFSVWPARPAPVGWERYGRTLVPLLSLGLLFLCVWNGETSFAVWACVLLIDLIALALAWAARSVVALIVALLATLITAGFWIADAPPATGSVAGMLTVVGGFGIFFSTAATLLTRRLGIGDGDARGRVPVLAAGMPFVLLLMLIAKLPLPNPTAIFAVALLLAVVLLGLGIVARTSWIAAVALGATWAVECTWHALHFSKLPRFRRARLVCGVFPRFRRVSVLCRAGTLAAMGARRALRAVAFLVDRHLGRLRLSASAEWLSTRGFRVAVCDRALALDR